jgi:hypothetical protein
MLAGRDPSPWFHAKHAQVDGVTLGWNDAVFADHAILFASADNFAGQQEQRAFGIVDQYEAVDLRAVVSHDGCGMPPNQALYIACLGDDHFSGAQPFIQC